MRAARFHAPGEPLRLEDVPRAVLAPDEVRVAVRASGVCGTELHFLEGLYSPARVPMTLGHEVAGVVAEAGPQVAG